MQSNRNIVIKGMGPDFSLDESMVWTSNTAEYPGSTLQLQDDGNLALIYNETITWSSKNGKSKIAF
ncbi:hypothetical protein [Flavobacterium sp. N2038]|uniref:hypothetical protein n=1 Tax=Flavobacterium sp. N2038 TaxID=2986829 RepID=UPI002223F3ED|nr:hypothetical protein [Flavobacterium sp. N2038]